MTNDDGLDAQLPISKPGLLTALDTAINQAIAFRGLVKASSTFANHPLADSQLDMSVTEIDAHIQYLRLLRDNISEDRCNNYPPVVRKRFKHDGTLI